MYQDGPDKVSGAIPRVFHEAQAVPDRIALEIFKQRIKHLYQLCFSRLSRPVHRVNFSLRSFRMDFIKRLRHVRISTFPLKKSRLFREKGKIGQEEKRYCKSFPCRRLFVSLQRRGRRFRAVRPRGHAGGLMLVCRKINLHARVSFGKFS